MNTIQISFLRRHSPHEVSLIILKINLVSW